MKPITLITREDLKRRMARQEDIQAVSVLTPEYCHRVSIPGLRKIPWADCYSRIDELDKSMEVVVYCLSYESSASQKAAEKLASGGFEVKVYRGGSKT